MIEKIYSNPGLLLAETRYITPGKLMVTKSRMKGNYGNT